MLSHFFLPAEEEGCQPISLLDTACIKLKIKTLLESLTKFIPILLLE